jgi:hypothetical protein
MVGALLSLPLCSVCRPRNYSAPPHGSQPRHSSRPDGCDGNNDVAMSCCNPTNNALAPAVERA